MIKKAILIVLNMALVATAFLLGRITAPEPQLDVTCGFYKNDTYYRNYCEDVAVPAECQPTGRCGQSLKCPQEKACGYLCQETVCGLIDFTCGGRQYQFEP